MLWAVAPPIQAQSSQAPVELRRIQADDWELARCVRYASLADAPDAFASTLAEEIRLPETLWQQRAASHAEGRETIGYLALRDSVPCGLVLGMRGSEAEVELKGLWVATNVRRRGIARALVQSVCDWARARGAGRIVLSVTTSSQAAIALYRKLGFEPLQEPQTTCGVRGAPALRMQKQLAT